MLLHKPQVYRHLLFNRLDYRDSGIDPSVMKLGLLLILFDVYVKWFQMEKQQQLNPDLILNPLVDSSLDPHAQKNALFWSIITQQYAYILLSCVAEFLFLHMAIRATIHFLYGSKYAIIKYNYVSMALILSSFAKLLLILMIVWDYYNQHHLAYAWLVNILVWTSNVEALGVFLNVGYVKTCLIMCTGTAVRIVSQYFLTGFS